MRECVYCGKPVGFGSTRCNAEPCYLGHIERLTAKLAAAMAVVEAAAPFVVEACMMGHPTEKEARLIEALANLDRVTKAPGR